MRDGRYQCDTLSRDLTAADMIDRYIAKVLRTKSQKPRYIEQQEAQLYWWRKEIGQYHLPHVTTYLIAEKRDLLAQTKQAGTVNRYLAVLSHAFATAKKEWNWQTRVAFELVSRPKEPRGRVRFLSGDEVSRLLNACKACKRKPLYQLVVLALATGARKGELLSLRWQDVDLVRGRAVVHETKNKERRALFLGDMAQEVLRELQRRKHPKSNLVFPARSGKRPMTIDREWTAARKRAVIEDFRFHDLRHTAASYLAMSGASLADIAEALGHKTLSMVKRYAHQAESHTAQVIAHMNTQLFNPQTQEQKHDSTG